VRSWRQGLRGDRVQAHVRSEHRGGDFAAVPAVAEVGVDEAFALDWL
jgi:hypothetical protein